MHNPNTGEGYRPTRRGIEAGTAGGAPWPESAQLRECPK